MNMVQSSLTDIPQWRGTPLFSDILKDVIDKAGGREKLTESQLKRLSEKKAELSALQRANPLLFYRPYESRLYPGRFPQDEFHRLESKISCFIGGNRSGKSESGFVEDCWWSLGTHPYKKVKVPNKGWIVSLNFKMSQQVSEAKLRKWLPPSEIVRWDSLKGMIYLRNGSTIGLKSCDQDLDAFGGEDLDWVHFDEEPPGQRGYQVYQECYMRTIDRKGRIRFTLTPVSGMSWTYDEFIEASVYDKDIRYIQVDTRENPFIPKDELDKIERKFSKDELDMRLGGKHVQFSGLVYKEFDSKVNVIPAFEVPSDWKRFRGIDHGINHPTACVWVAVSPKDEYYVYEEYYESNKTIEQNVSFIKQITGGDRIAWTMIDAATEARNSQTGRTDRQTYKEAGIMTRVMRTERMYGVNIIRQMLRPDPVTKRPKLFIFDTCINLIREFQRYRFQTGRMDDNNSDKPVKFQDDALDALRYILVSNPRYDLEDSYDYSSIDQPVWYK